MTTSDQALAAARTGDTLVAPKLDRLARSADARAIADALIARGVKLAVGASVYYAFWNCKPGAG